MKEFADYIFRCRMEGWCPLKFPYYYLFNEDEIAYLERSSRFFQPDKRVIVILSFENSLAKVGGLGTILSYFPEALQKVGEKVIHLTPFHYKNPFVKEALKSKRLIEKFSQLEVKVCNFRTLVSCYEDKKSIVPTFHVAIDDCFGAGENIYSYDNPEKLLFDSLAFTAVVPSVLAKLGYTDNILFHAHDWETGPISIFSLYAVISSILTHAKSVLTLHNSFDSPLPEKFKYLFFNKNLSGYTVLQTCIPYFTGPLTTVSFPFAYELRHDPLQYGVFADHLQKIFQMNPPVGIENGIFGDGELPFSHEEGEKIPSDKTILTKKNEWRKEFFSIINSEKNKERYGFFAPEFFNNPDVPILLMSGRLDCGQKGFDVIFQALRRIEKGRILLFFSPNVQNNIDTLKFFVDLCEEMSGTIIIWPFWISGEKYQALLRGANFFVMPSFYEPFGAISEAFLSGTPVIARATGGILSQVKGKNGLHYFREYKPFSPSVNNGDQNGWNGILFKENFDEERAKYLWRELLNQPLHLRLHNELYVSMIDAAYKAIIEAIEIFQKKDQYVKMIVNGIKSVQPNSWLDTAKKYQRVFDVTSYRG
ncbi:MAG: glycogen/starch synthase [Chitinispirillaceae bacterium]|nr:glycogen/starch synthase [Chitinispirillaceae bacterium]